MSLFTFVLDYRGGTYIQQVEAANEERAVEAWARVLNLDDIQGLTAKSRPMLQAKFLGQELAPVSGSKSVWCVSARLRGSLALVHVIRTEV